jgi:sn-glycerol 3-phosphate transport system permease protein
MAFAFFDAPHAAAMTIMVLLLLGIVAGIKFSYLDKRTHYQ